MNASSLGPDARGPLPASPAGAAALYKAAELSACPAHSFMTLAHASPADVARAALGLDVHEGQSPLAIARGVRFENRLAADGGARLREALAPVSPRAAHGPMLDLHEDVPMPTSGAGRAAALRERERRTLAALRGRRPAVVWQAALTVRIGAAAFRVKPDLLADTGAAYAVGEVKSYPDRGPRTPQPDVAGALGQAAVGQLALAQAAAAGHGGGPDPAALLVLAAPGTLGPSLRAQRTDRELAVLLRALDAMPAAAASAARAMPAGTTLADAAAVEALPTAYSGLCRSRCALAAWCRARARDAAAGLLAGTTLHAAAAAAAGAGEPDAGVSAREIAAAGAAWRTATGR